MKISKLKICMLLLIILVLVAEIFIATKYKTVTYGISEEVINEDIEIDNNEDVELSNDELKVLELINEYRKQNGLNELKIYSKLQQVAKIKAEDIVNNNYFSHTSPNYGTPFELMSENKIKYKIAGENLAGNITSEKAVKAWIDSTTHRENILEDKYEYTGICVIESDIYGKVFVQMFMGV